MRDEGHRLAAAEARRLDTAEARRRLAEAEAQRLDDVADAVHRVDAVHRQERLVVCA
jgi:hypothetical protein